MYRVQVFFLHVVAAEAPVGGYPEKALAVACQAHDRIAGQAIFAEEARHGAGLLVDPVKAVLRAHPERVGIGDQDRKHAVVAQAVGTGRIVAVVGERLGARVEDNHARVLRGQYEASLRVVPHAKNLIAAQRTVFRGVDLALTGVQVDPYQASEEVGHPEPVLRIHQRIEHMGREQHAVLVIEKLQEAPLSGAEAADAAGPAADPEVAVRIGGHGEDRIGAGVVLATL